MLWRPPTELQALARARRRQRYRDARRVSYAWVRLRLVPLAGSILGLGCLVCAAFTIGLTLGLVCLGAVLFIAEWRIRG